MFKRIAILSMCLCLLAATACADSSSGSSSSETESSSVFENPTTTESSINIKSDIKWNDVKYYNVSGLYIPIPEGFANTEESSKDKVYYRNSDDNVLIISSADGKIDLNDDYLKRLVEDISKPKDVSSISFSTKVLKSEITTIKDQKAAVVNYKASTLDSECNYINIYFNGREKSIGIILGGNIATDENYKSFCELLDFSEMTRPATTTTSSVSSKETTTTEATTTQATTTLSREYQNAVNSALSWLKYDAYSRSGLIERLEADKFPKDAATYAVDHCGADWNEQAVKSAKRWLKYDNTYSKQGLIDRLIADGYTQAQAQHGADVAYQ